MVPIVPIFAIVGVSLMRSASPFALIGVPFVIGVPILLFAFFSFNRLIWLEYTTQRQAWIASGKPEGYLWRAPECDWKSGLATHRHAFAWLVHAPQWIQQTDGASLWLNRYRVSVLFWNVMVIGAFGYVLSRPH